MGATPFSSRTLWEHLLRGAAGITAFAVSMRIIDHYPLTGLLLIGCMIFAFRGCPVCWTVGLIDTIRSLRPARRAESQAQP